MELPLFPLHTVLCPGVALPLHVFEERYRRLVARCLDRDEAFGVVLIREGREVGGGELRLARIGTTALIREAGRYSDGRFELLTVGAQRFHIASVAQGRDRYLVADVALLDEDLGDPAAARHLSGQVSERFLEYLELLQPALTEDEDGPEIEVEFVTEDPDAPDARGAGPPAMDQTAVARRTDDPQPLQLAGSDAERRELLMAAARRLVTPGEPTAISYVLAGLIQIELGTRQTLLEAPSTETRLRQLDELLRREVGLLRRHLKPLVVDTGADAQRRN